MKSRLVILDSNIIIEAFKNDFWVALISQYDVYVASTVAHVEVTHYRDNENVSHAIDLNSFITSNKITEISADATDLQELEKKLNPNMMHLIDAGEKEIIALMVKGSLDNHLFCTGDTRAIKVVSALGMGTQAISLEDLLNKIGLKNRLPNPSYSKSAFERCKADGLVEQENIIKK